MKKAKKVTFEGWKNCIEISSGKFRVIVSTEIGPRVIGAFYGNSKNLFHVDPALAGKKAEKGWVNYGGHRLWHSPETKERTYEPDNGENKVTVIEMTISSSATSCSIFRASTCRSAKRL